MEISTSGKACDVAASLVAPPADEKSAPVPVADRTGVSDAVAVLLRQAGVAADEHVEAHFAVGVDGGWAVLRVGRVVTEE